MCIIVISHKMVRLNDQDRAIALGELQAGRSQRQVARSFGISQSTVSALVDRFKQPDTLRIVPDLEDPGPHQQLQMAIFVDQPCVSATSRHWRFRMPLPGRETGQSLPS